MTTEQTLKAEQILKAIQEEQKACDERIEKTFGELEDRINDLRKRIAKDLIEAGKMKTNEALIPATFDEAWELLRDIPTDEEDCIELPYLCFEVGTNREEIWHWLEEEYDICLGDYLTRF